MPLISSHRFLAEFSSIFMDTTNTMGVLKERKIRSKINRQRILTRLTPASFPSVFPLLLVLPVGNHRWRIPLTSSDSLTRSNKRTKMKCSPEARILFSYLQS